MKIRPIRTSEELELVHKVAQADGHHLFWPTHVMEKDDYVVGSLSVMPTVQIWLDTKRTQVRDTLFLKDHLEATMANSTRVFCIPCTDDSPLLKVLNKPELGYLHGGKLSLYFKGV